MEPGDNWLLKLSKIFIWPILCLAWSLSEVADQQDVSKHLKKTALGVSQLQLVINHERCMPCYEEIQRSPETISREGQVQRLPVENFRCTGIAQCGI